MNPDAGDIDSQLINDIKILDTTAQYMCLA